MTDRSKGSCNFFPSPKTSFAENSGSVNIGDSKYNFIYRCFQSLYFFIVQDRENDKLLALNILNLIVQALNVVLIDVKELVIVLNFELSNFVIDEIILGGGIREVDIEVIADAVKMQHLQVGVGLNERKDGFIDSIKDIMENRYDQ